jgi:hypothetical protein
MLLLIWDYPRAAHVVFLLTSLFTIELAPPAPPQLTYSLYKTLREYAAA